MEKVIATIVIIVLTLGLISYAVIGQMGGFKDTSDQVNEEQNRLNMLLQDSSLVPASTVRYYIQNQKTMNYTVAVYDGPEQNVASEISKQMDSVGESAMFKMKKQYDDYGKISKVIFTLVSQAAG